MKEPVDIIREELETVRRRLALKLAKFELLERIKRRCRFVAEQDHE